MKLDQYLRERDGKLTRDGSELQRIAKIAGLSPYTLYMVALGHKDLAPKRAPNVERGTGFAVSVVELCPDFPWPSEKRKAA